MTEARDADRDAWLAEAGYAVLRFDNAAILHNPNLVFEAVRGHVEGLRRHPSSVSLREPPSPTRGEGWCRFPFDPGQSRAAQDDGAGFTRYTSGKGETT
ncbi:DUF559 domain-containing protein [Brevundimonas sp.]|uniref:DUF559 domain-containing protein n=1 Tax=Brevundimonas sp. TaxID=1871086 RepID=UPI003916F771